MLKYMVTTFVTASISVATTLVAVDFQRERLTYSISGPVQLGDLTHQKLRITNDGWRPAINVKIYLAGNLRSPADLQATIDASPPFDLTKSMPAALGGYERLRKDESAVIDLTFKGPPLSAGAISVKSDETIASLEGNSEARTLLSGLMKLMLPGANASKEKVVKLNCGI